MHCAFRQLPLKILNSDVCVQAKIVTLVASLCAHSTERSNQLVSGHWTSLVNHAGLVHYLHLIKIATQFVCIAMNARGWP